MTWRPYFPRVFSRNVGFQDESSSAPCVVLHLPILPRRGGSEFAFVFHRCVVARDESYIV